MITKESISVYNPEDEWQQSIQKSSFNYDKCWLSSFQCRLLSQASLNLKDNSDWFYNKPLSLIRSSFFFRPMFGQFNQNIVFITHPIFLSDILENENINFYLHGPIILMSKVLSHFVFYDTPVHILCDMSSVISKNKQLIKIGNTYISDQNDVSISNCIKEVICTRYDLQNTVNKILKEYNLSSPNVLKAAMKEVSEEVYSIDEHERTLKTNKIAVDKYTKDEYVITMIEPGENGMIALIGGENHKVVLSKNDFDNHFFVRD